MFLLYDANEYMTLLFLISSKMSDSIFNLIISLLIGIIVIF